MMRIILVRNCVELPDDSFASAGDVVDLPAVTALALLQNSAADQLPQSEPLPPCEEAAVDAKERNGGEPE